MQAMTAAMLLDRQADAEPETFIARMATCWRRRPPAGPCWWR